MTVAHQTALEDVTLTTGWDTAADPYTFSFTPAAAPQGIAVFVSQFDVTTDAIVSITYGGVSMTRIVTAVDTTTEIFRTYCYFLGTGIPTGTQTVSIDHNGTATSDIAIYVVSVTAAADTTIGASAIDENDQADPQAALDTGASSSLRYAYIRSGQGIVTGLTRLASMVGVLSQDHGNNVSVLDRQTTASTGSFTVGWTATSDDCAAVYIAIQEAAAAATSLITSGFPQALLVQ